MHLDKTEEAIKVYDRLLSVDPSSSAARFNRASLLAAVGRTKEAEEDYRAVLASQPDHREAAVSFTDLLQRQRRFPETVELWLMYLRAADVPSRPERDKDEVRAWLAWAYVLANRSEQARELVDTIPETAAARAFADWAMAYDSLRAGDAEAFVHRLGPPRRPGTISIEQQEQGRSILAALMVLGPSVRDLPVGRARMLFRALLFAGDEDAAQAAAEQVINLPNAGHWADAARELVATLDSDAPNAVTEPASGAAGDRSWPR